ncbi:MAG TPA: hypothetical protein VF607_04960 [Verrucomicrobiae bacterium]
MNVIHSPSFPFLLGGLMLWGVYRRIRRQIGRQPVRPVRSGFSVSIFTLLIGVLGWLEVGHLAGLAALGGGLVAGAGLGFLGWRLTRFETTAAGRFYYPNTYLGVALSVLFAGRMLYRFWHLNQAGLATTPGWWQSPLTLFIFGLLAGYYIVYHLGIIHYACQQA